MIDSSPLGSLQDLLHALRAGDDSAREALIQHTIGRCRELARRMLNKAWDLRQIDQTDDVAQKAMLRLYKTLAHVKPPDAVAFYGLVARQIRWVLSDLARERGAAKVIGYRADLPETEDPASGPGDLAEWSEFHEKINGLPDEDREVFDLLFYDGLTQEEASAVLEMSVRSVKRRWQRARLSLAHALHGEWPRV